MPNTNLSPVTFRSDRERLQLLDGDGKKDTD